MGLYEECHRQNPSNISPFWLKMINGNVGISTGQIFYQIILQISLALHDNIARFSRTSSDNVASHFSTMTTSLTPEMSSSNELSDSILVDREHRESCNLTNHLLETSATSKTNLVEFEGPDIQIIP